MDDAGRVLIIQYKGQLYSHYAVSDGKGGIIHVDKKKGKIVRDKLDKYLGKIKSIKYVDDVPEIREVIYRRASESVGDPYWFDLVVHNCESWVSHISTGKKESKQVNEWCSVAALAILTLGILS